MNIEFVVGSAPRAGWGEDDLSRFIHVQQSGLPAQAFVVKATSGGIAVSGMGKGIKVTANGKDLLAGEWENVVSGTTIFVNDKPVLIEYPNLIEIEER